MHFFPSKASRNCSFDLDSHLSQCNFIEMLEFAQSEDILLICLSIHITHYLQSPDYAILILINF